MFNHYMGMKKMTIKYTESKLLNMTQTERAKLEEIRNKVSESGGDVSVNQLLRDGIELLYNYKMEIVERYTPKSIKELIKVDVR
ncbi:hypothetical protein DSECCO2_466390 [anaerobic digester metagenome]